MSKILDLVTKPSPSTKIVLSSIILRHDKGNISAKVNRGNETIKQYYKANKLALIDNSNKKDQKLYGKKKLHLNKARKPLLANNFIKYFMDM